MRLVPPVSVLLALPLLFLAQAPVETGDTGKLEQRLRDVEQRLEQERATWLGFRAEAGSEEERAELRAAFPREDFLGELRAIAGAAPGSDVAGLAWLDVLRLGVLLDEPGLFGEGLSRLLAEHLESPLMGRLNLELAYGVPPWTAPRAADALRRIVAGTPLEDVRLGTIANLALLVGLDDSFGAAGREEAEGLLQRIEEEFGDRDLIGVDGRQFAAGARFEMQNLRLGQTVPDVELHDQEGVAFRLSDYRGRVVVLDFWGFV